MPGLPGAFHWLIYVALVVCLVVAAWLFNGRVRAAGVSPAELAHGLRELASKGPGEALAVVGAEVFGQRRVRRRPYAGLMHLLIFGSYGMLTLGTVLIAVQHDFTGRFFGVTFLNGNFYLVEKALLDTAALGLLAGVGMAAWRRLAIRPVTLGARPTVVIAYAALAVMAATGLLLEAMRELAYPVSWSHWTYAGHLVALAITPLVGRLNLGAYQATWVVHVLAAFIFMGGALATALDHVVLVPLNIALQSSRAPGELRLPFNLAELFESGGDLEGVSSGFANPSELDWKRRFMLASCVNCGRCEEVCPANAAGRPLSPRKLVQALKGDLLSPSDGAGDLFARGVLDTDTVWSCLSCGACARECPAFIDQPGTIVEMRRHLVEEGNVDEAKALVLAQLERNQNPLGLPSYQRFARLAEAGVPTIEENPGAEYLYWVGCMSSYDQRAWGVASAVISLLRLAGVNFAVLGESERCLGECQRKLGDEAGFQMRSMEIAETLRSHGVTKIVTHCPHCLVTLGRDYRSLDMEFQVVHHSELVQSLLAQGRLPTPKSWEGGKLTYHDPCNLGRLSGVFDAPRGLAASVAGESFVELERSREKSFCCGAGGSNYFYKVPAQESVSGLRLAEAQAAGASTVATACPFCLSMLEDAARTAPGGQGPRVADLAELLAEALGLEAAAAP